MTSIDAAFVVVEFMKPLAPQMLLKGATIEIVGMLWSPASRSAEYAGLLTMAGSITVSCATEKPLPTSYTVLGNPPAPAG